MHYLDLLSLVPFIVVSVPVILIYFRGSPYEPQAQALTTAMFFSITYVALVALIGGALYLGHGISHVVVFNTFVLSILGLRRKRHLSVGGHGPD